MKSEKMIEIFVRWQGTLIRVEQFNGDYVVELNGDEPFVTVPLEWLGEESHLLISCHDNVAIAHLLPSMDVSLNGKKYQTIECSIELNDEMKIKMGPFQFEIRCCEAPMPIMSPFSGMTDKTPLPA